MDPFAFRSRYFRPLQKCFNSKSMQTIPAIQTYHISIFSSLMELDIGPSYYGTTSRAKATTSPPSDSTLTTPDSKSTTLDSEYGTLDSKSKTQDYKSTALDVISTPLDTRIPVFKIFWIFLFLATCCHLHSGCISWYVNTPSLFNMYSASSYTFWVGAAYVWWSIFTSLAVTLFCFSVVATSHCWSGIFFDLDIFTCVSWGIICSCSVELS